MDTTPELTQKDLQEILAQFGLEHLNSDVLKNIRGALLAAYCMGITASEQAE